MLPSAPPPDPTTGVGAVARPGAWPAKVARGEALEMVRHCWHIRRPLVVSTVFEKLYDLPSRNVSSTRPAYRALVHECST